jgi:N-acylneuraminate cytidylyltransferase
VALSCLGLIPARGGSKGIPRKNVRPLAGRPLIDYTFSAARASRLLTRVVLSTDDREIAALGEQAGIEVPFLRPAELAADDTPMLPVVEHALEALERGEGYRPDALVLLQPTAPLRTARHIDESIELLASTPVDAVVSVTAVPGHCHLRWQLIIEDGRLRSVTGEPLAALAARRQDLGPTYTRNGAVYAFRTTALREHGSIYGAAAAAYVMAPEESLNLDTEDDWKLGTFLISGGNQECPHLRRKAKAPAPAANPRTPRPRRKGTRGRNSRSTTR